MTLSHQLGTLLVLYTFFIGLSLNVGAKRDTLPSLNWNILAIWPCSSLLCQQLSLLNWSSAYSSLSWFFLIILIANSFAFSSFSLPLSWLDWKISDKSFSYPFIAWESFSISILLLKSPIHTIASQYWSIRSFLAPSSLYWFFLCKPEKVLWSFGF
jgi:hypothetical protein